MPASETASRQFAMLALLLGVALGAGFFAAQVDRRTLEDRQLDMLQIEARRKSIEIMSTTLNGNLMGAITLLGLSNAGLPREARNQLFVADPHIYADLRQMGLAFGADGAFVVGQDGVVKSSWDARDKSSTGLDVRFRPYFKTTMTGKTNVYAAVSLSQGRRALYFAAPVIEPASRSTVGAVVARTDLARVDGLLQGDFDRALLLSPQDVVFASNQPEWIGSLGVQPSAERLTQIRQLKQFGAMFERRDPKVLPFDLSRGVRTEGQHRYAVASAEVSWNDPLGPWTVVLMQDLSDSAQTARAFTLGGLVSTVVLLLGWMGLRLRRSQQRQHQATEQLRQFAKQQEATAIFRAELSQMAARLQRCERLPELSSVFLEAAREMLDAMQGAVYVASLGTPQRLHLAGAAAAGAAVPTLLNLGEGLLGQCAQERQLRVVPTPGNGPWTLRSGLGNASPAALVLAPLLLRDQLVGVVELALLREPDGVQQARLQEMLSLLTNSLEILRRREGVTGVMGVMPRSPQGRESTLEVNA
ncbi:MAG TPA: GAF domain-containing protein [Burkholderiaceae bacterium]|jgi:C4-dicarboxylate-specific signal transduction histidine kinase